MALQFGEGVFNALAHQPDAWGSFMEQANGFQNFFKKRADNKRDARVQGAMDASAGDLATAVGGEDYAKAADLATRAGDYDRAMAYAKLANDKQAQLANMAYRNALLGMQMTEKQNKLDQQAKADADMRAAAISALRELKDLSENGDIYSGNKSTDQWFLSGKSSKNLGRRTAALSALLPMTNAKARASGGSGINTMGEMMAYLGLPENPTSAQIAGALPGLMNRLGVSEADLENIGGMSDGNMGGMAF